jgi:hypothetical protein
MANRCHVITKFDKLGTYRQGIRPAVAAGIQKGILDIEARTKARIVQNGQVDTGNMLNSAYSQMTGEMQGEAGVSAEYAAFQELGYKGIPGRPFLGPSFAETVPEVQAFIGAALNHA